MNLDSNHSDKFSRHDADASETSSVDVIGSPENTANGSHRVDGGLNTKLSSSSTNKSVSDIYLKPTSKLSRRDRMVNNMGIFTIVFAAIVGTATLLILVGKTPIAPTHNVVVTALVVNGIVSLLLLIAVTLKLWPLLKDWRVKAAGSRLHIAIVGMFSLVAIIPTAIVALIALYTLGVGLDRWFSDRVKAIIGNSLTVAQAYEQEHALNLRDNLNLMAVDLERAKPLFDRDIISFQSFLTRQTALRNLPASYLLRTNGSILLTSTVTFPFGFEMPGSEILSRVEKDNPVLVRLKSDQVGGIARLNDFDDVLLFIVRKIDPRVTQYTRTVEEGVNEYSSLEEEGRRIGLTVAFALIYTSFALMLLLMVIWIGISIASRLISPIRLLIRASEQVSEGNLSVSVPVQSSADIAHLSAAFNTMTQRLREQRNELIDTHQTMDRRRKFTEAVLSGVSAGVLGLDDNRTVVLANRSVLALLKESEDQVIGKKLVQLLPEVDAVLDNDREKSGRLMQVANITVSLRGSERTFMVRFTYESEDDRVRHTVVTMDDITELMMAQRSSAWSDVARRIAHEIKNPLTPIQLSAERLRRKYGHVIKDDRETFDQCTNTIIRQVGDLGRMVDEFSAFARMPKPIFEQENLGNLVKEVLFLARVGFADAEIELRHDANLTSIKCDGRLITQAIMNVIKNSYEAIQENRDDRNSQVRILMRLYQQNEEEIILELVDNGPGFPQDNRQSLFEPYNTTREKGTGLGLAIVRKIIEDHGGHMELLDASASYPEYKGALVRIILPISA